MTRLRPATYKRENRLSEIVTNERIDALELTGPFPESLVSKTLNLHSKINEKWQSELEKPAVQQQVQAWLKEYRAYIGQANCKEEHELRISRFITYCVDNLNDCVLVALGKDKFFYQAWIKYANSVSDTEDVFDYMLEKKIGVDYASVYKTIA